MAKALKQLNCPSCGKNIDLDEVYAENMDSIVEQRLANEKAKLASKIAIQERAKAQTKLEDLKRQVSDNNQLLEESQKRELGLLAKARKVEEQAKTIELEIARQVKEKTAQAEARSQNNLKHKLEIQQQEFALKEAGLKTKLEEAQKKLNQGSQQAQGEVLELMLEDKLKNLYPEDQIKPVEKGIRGADIVQEVFNQFHRSSGKIVWEVKNTKNWSDIWIQKLKEDQRQIKADIAVIVSTVLPPSISNFAQTDGVWLTSPQAALSLSAALRQMLIEVYAARQANIGKDQKIEDIYQYFSGHGFRQRIETIVEAFQTMQADLNKEKSASLRNFAKREKQLERVVFGTMGMHGDLEGLIGTELPQIQGLEDQEAILSNPPTQLESTFIVAGANKKQDG